MFNVAGVLLTVLGGAGLVAGCIQTMHELRQMREKKSEEDKIKEQVLRDTPELVEFPDDVKNSTILFFIKHRDVISRIRGYSGGDNKELLAIATAVDRAARSHHDTVRN
jgi:hypothetical protein